MIGHHISLPDPIEQGSMLIRMKNFCEGSSLHHTLHQAIGEGEDLEPIPPSPPQQG